MAKRSSNGGAYQDPHSGLFARVEESKRRRLFLPNVLDEAAGDRRLATKQRDAAYKVIKHWWQMARQGKLNRKETSLDDMFLSDVFGQGLGYRGVTETTGQYERERQFSVPGVGPCDGALGIFPPADPPNVRVVIELKDAATHLDRDRFNRRTPVR